ncbi:hypothetical protein [Psychroserpens mesophilus]|uniref:hypothetical protein n=1 Tax=Psychroserpens mesophilus TaxID=325473 RepID=UPI003D656B16
MKKNILLIAAALFLFLGNQSVTAQAKMEKERKSISVEKSHAKAKEMTSSLIRPLGLNTKQQEEVYALFSKVEMKMGKVRAEVSSQDQKDKQTKMDEYVMASMKEILNEEQFKKYIELAKKL